MSSFVSFRFSFIPFVRLFFRSFARSRCRSALADDLNGLLNGLLTPLLKGLTGFALRIELGTPGADLIRINGTRISTRFESLNGLDNVENYGIRTLRSVHCSHNGKSNDLLFVGTANPASNNPLGGWFLKCLKPK